MKNIILKAESRELLGKKVKTLRNDGQLPVVLYGRKFEALSLVINEKEFLKVLKEAGEATIINIEIPGKETAKALIRHIQKDPVSDRVIHADLYKVDMSQEIETEIPLVYEGVSPAVEELEGNFITNKDTIKVKCLPDKLVSEIKVDITSLKTFEDLIHVKDLNIPEGIKVLDEEEDIVAQVTAPTSEEELEAMDQEAAVDTEKAQIENMETEAEKEKAEKEAEGAEEEQPVKEQKNEK
ncbi:MAG: 50S ribosomal protein L25 [Patescibacteria group bacterium]